MDSITAKKTFPSWVNDFVRKYHSRTISQYILHGNIYDYVPVRQGENQKYPLLRDFLSNDLFGKADLVVYYDRSSGIRFKTRDMKVDFLRSLEAYDTVNGSKFAKSVPRDPVRAFTLLEMHFRKRLMEKKEFSIAFIVEYAETLIPMANAAHYNPEDRAIQVFLQRWANEGLFKMNDLIIVLLTENIINLNQGYVRSPYNYEIALPYCEESERKAYIDHFLDHYNRADEDFDPYSLLEMSSDVLAKNTAGLNLAHLRVLLAEIVENRTKFTFGDLNQKKKEIIESEAGGLLEFVQSKYSLADVAGHKQAKHHLLQTADAVRTGRNDVVPMGYLVAGPVGTGKTFLITCFANDIGVPMVILKNFRSKYQGETEGNLEKVLHLLEAMTPVAVMIDEADAYLGQRNAEGDSGVSSRVFSMIASFMSNTDHRGKIIWFLVTARPDLMPVDFKRQGRAEEHIALFYPASIAEKRELFQIMLRKTGLKDLDLGEVEDKFFEEMTVNSGAEMEAALTRAKFRAAAENAEVVTIDIIKAAMADFLPPTYPMEIELMNYAAVLECTSKALLPARYAEMDRQEVVEKVNELKRQVEMNM
ncbi:MAG TPA: AAA family ATPase [Bacteroidetes bacterium]|nr:AAA family ATPase [Bacteroidota bacterium]